MNYIKGNNLISENQFGYRAKRSTELATTLFADAIRKAPDNGTMTGAVYFDLSKAFDTLGHDHLLENLKSYGIKGLALRWFTDYLFQRSQKVKLGQERTHPCPLVCGVPQGSILGPMLFLLFFSDFNDCLNHCSVLQFADDTVIFVSSKKVSEIESLLNKDLASGSLYLETNDLVANLNKGKTESMLFGTSKRISTVPAHSSNLKLFCNNIPINCTNSYTYLGTILDKNLLLNTDFESKYKKASKKLGVLRKLMSFMTSEAAQVVYTSIIVSAFKYNCTVHLNLNQSQQSKLKSLQRRAESMCNVKTTPILNVFNKQVVMLVRKCFDGNVAPSFKDYFKLREHNKTLT